MSALFNGLVRGRRYVVSLATGGQIEAVCHGYNPDGTITFAKEATTYHINPAHIVWAKPIRNAS